MAERVDAVVIGAGLGGLAAAVELARGGRRTVVLEHQTVPGGYAQCFQRGPYRFDASLHALNGLAPGGGADALYRDLGIWDRLRLNRLDPLYRMRLPGLEVVAHADPFRYEAELIGCFPDEAEGIRAYLDEALAVYRDARRLEVDEATGRAPRLADLTARYPSLVRVSGQTWEQMMVRHVADPETRAALGALWGYVGLPPSECAAIVGAALTSYYEHGGWYPEGGAQAVSDALVEVLRELGGEIRLGQLVDRIDVSSGRATAVTTREGLHLEAGLVVSNANAPTTMLELVGRDRLPTEYVGQVEAPEPSYTTFSVYLGLGRDVLTEQGLGHELLVTPSYDLHDAWRAAQVGDWARTALSITDYTRVDPGCAPEGHGVVVLTTAASWDYEDTWGTGGHLVGYHQNPRYLHLKEHVADVLLARASEAVPGLADAIRYREASTPLTNFHYTGNPRGAIEGYENSPRHSGLGWLSHQTPLDNLFLAGAWTNSGGMNPSMASGLHAARRAMTVVPGATVAT